jgi:diaminohydroxyphosphoribosylaminopyrimidine deaminase/5-amino-6-(5-phosphoribosylamino)uracil reductase
MQDPNPQVAGRGIQMLREAGIEVEVGLLETDAEALNPAFIKRMKSGMPYVQLKMAASLDGQTALANGESQWITSPQARQDVQKFRAQAGAILSASQTVIPDNASLNVRWSDLPSSVQAVYPQTELRQPQRIILDRRAKLNPDLKLFQSEPQPLIVAEHGDIAPQLNRHQRIDLKPLLHTLANDYNLNHLWVEAGATLASSFIRQGFVDELIIYLAPKIMGSDGRGLLGALGLESMSDVIDLDIQDMRMVGQDIRIVASLKNREV